MTPPEFVYRFDVALHDTDAAGLLFFGHLFRHAHDAYEAFMARLGYPLPGILRDGRWLLPVVHAEADYRSAIRHGEALRVEVAVAEIGRSSFQLAYRFLDGDDRVRATARTVHVSMAPDGSGSLTLDEALRTALSGARR